MRSMEFINPVKEDAMMCPRCKCKPCECPKEDTMMEKAPPGMEAMVLKLKKEYPGHPELAFATAWSIYNKKHGKK